MSIKKISEALAAIDKSGLDRSYLNHKFAVSPQEITEAEMKLGFEFPESYREFLKKFGSGGFEGEEFYGLIPGKPDRKSILNGLRFTLELHESGYLPKNMFAFLNFDGDAVACLVLSEMKDGECPVILWDHSESVERQLKKPYILADSFGDYFFNRISELIEDMD